MDPAIGLTIVSFGTSAPELVVNSIASFDGHANIVLGNIIGRNNFNLFIIGSVRAEDCLPLPRPSPVNQSASSLFSSSRMLGSKS